MTYTLGVEREGDATHQIVVEKDDMSDGVVTTNKDKEVVPSGGEEGQ
jgi:hypothetical protein